MTRAALVADLVHLAVALPAHDVPVGPGHQPGVRIGADEQHGLGGARRHEALGDLKAEGDRRALLANVERRHALDAELRAEQPARARESVLRRHRTEDDEVDFFRSDAGVVAGAPGGMDAHVRDAFTLADEVALLNPRALPDPLVVGLHDLGECRVRHGGSGHVVPRPDDRDPHEVRSSPLCRSR